MGYRSEVDVVFYVHNDSDTTYPLLKLWFDANYPHTEARDEWDAEIDYDEENQAILVSYQDVKWSSTYEHPQRVDKAFDDIDKLLDDQSLTPVKEDDPDAVPFDIAWEFVRLGEDDDDIETRASENADFVIAVNRTTEISFTPPTKKVTT
jgi:hypothetical protein